MIVSILKTTKFSNLNKIQVIKMKRLNKTKNNANNPIYGYENFGGDGSLHSINEEIVVGVDYICICEDFACIPPGTVCTDPERHCDCWW